MDFNRNSNGAFVNPYAKRPAAEASESNDLANDVAINTVVTDFNMGIQSQLRDGAIRKSKEMATKAKTKRVYKQKAIGGSTEVLKVQCSANTQNGQCSADSCTWNSNFDTPTNVQSVLESVNPRQEIIFLCS
jgi:hypothetical protein